MVLHHILQGAAGIIVSAAGFHAHILQGGNLHRFNIAGIPYVCKNGIGKPDCLDIADHFFSKIVVDAVNMLRAKEHFQLFVKGCGRSKVLAERLFKYHLAGGRTVDQFESFCDDAEKTGSHCKVKDVGVDIIFPVIVIQSMICFQTGEIHPVIIYFFRKTVKCFFLKGEPGEFLHPVPGNLTVMAAVVVPAANDGDAAVLRKLSGDIHGIKCRKKLAEGKIPGAAEDGKVSADCH